MRRSPRSTRAPTRSGASRWPPATRGGERGWPGFRSIPCHVHHGGEAPAGHGGLAVPPGRQHRPGQDARADRAAGACQAAARIPASSLPRCPASYRNLADAWARRSEPNIVRCTTTTLSADLAGEMRVLAALLEIAVPEQAWPALADVATFRRMRSSAGQHDRLHRPPGVLKRRAAFFRRGS